MAVSQFVFTLPRHLLEGDDWPVNSRRVIYEPCSHAPASKTRSFSVATE